MMDLDRYIARPQPPRAPQTDASRLSRLVHALIVVGSLMLGISIAGLTVILVTEF